MDQFIKTLPAILKATGLSAEVAEAACIGAWKHAAGERLSRHAVAVQLQHFTLIVVVDDEAWKTQLHQMRGQFIFRLNSVLGQTLVKSIEFRVDPKKLVSLRGSEENRNMQRERSDYEVPFELVSAAATISDADLRRAFLGAAISCVRRLEKI